GLCTDHEQHTCLAIVEITEACNLRCPTCFADSDVGRFAPLDEVERMLDTIVANEGYADVVQFSGGEPTIHPQILEIVALAKTKRIKAVMINTNGVRLARDEEFVRRLSAFTGNFEIYLHFDGFDPLDRTTVPDVIHAVEAQTAGMFRATDFVPLPCHAECISMTYAYVKGGKVKPLPRYVDVKAYLDVIGNQINFGVDDVKNVVGPALTRLWSASTPLSGVSALRDFSCCLPVAPGALSQKEHGSLLYENMFRLVIIHFMDAWNFDVRAAKKCCVHHVL